MGNAMTKWSLNDLRELNTEYAKSGIPFFNRPLMAATKLLGCNNFLEAIHHSEFDRIVDAFSKMIPEVDENWPGSGVGYIANLDQVVKVTFPVIYGQEQLEVWKMAGFSNKKEWFSWCHENLSTAAETAFAVADIYDFAYGLNQVEKHNANAAILWRMARSNLDQIASALPSVCDPNAMIQPIFMVAELSIKAALAWHGIDIESFRKGKNGHNITRLAKCMAKHLPHHEDARVQAVVGKLPSYVSSRYAPAGLTRLQVVELALGVQFVAASCLRRIAGTDLSDQMQADADWPGPRPEFTIWCPCENPMCPQESA